jgi:molybdopterin-containing oxidoreductase family iron-sulfur binding subunit
MSGPGGRIWRRLEAAAADPGFVSRAAREFPALSSLPEEPLDRRQALKLMAAAIVWGGVTGCDSNFGQDLIPAVRVPPNIVPALPNFYATAHVLDGFANGVVVKHSMGRPLQVEGNVRHPSSLGATDAFAQALPLDFYDPDREAEIDRRGRPADWPTLEGALARERDRLASGHGAGLRILTGSVTSPTLLARLDALLDQYPEARWVRWDPISRGAVAAGAAMAYGRPLDTVARLENTDVLLAIDGDLLCTAPGRLRYARDLAGRRNPSRSAAMSRIYALESTPTLLGSVADHRFIAAPAEIERIVAALAAGIAGPEAAGSRAPGSGGSGSRAGAAGLPAWVGPVLADLRSARDRALVHAGAMQPPPIHALAHAMNEALGGRGTTFDLIEPVARLSRESADTLPALVADMHAGKVDTLLMIDSNPVLTAPGVMGFRAGLERVRFSLALAERRDETAQASGWFVPLAHQWECWSDARGHDGTATILQPQSLPLYGGVSAPEMLQRLSSAAHIPGDEIVRATWLHPPNAAAMGSGWLAALAEGVVQGSARPAVHDRLRETPRAPAADLGGAPVAADTLSVLFRADPALWDGRFANNPWLQELPRPLTKLVWDNPLLIAPRLAERMRLENGDCVRLAVGTASVIAPVWILPGQSPSCITALLGSGRGAAGAVGDAAGVDYYPLTGIAGPISVQKVAGRVELARTVRHHGLLAPPDEVLRHGTLRDFHADPRFAADRSAAPELYRTVPPGPAKWAMSIDLNACIGCNACVLACQAENNVPVVGKREVLREREMHWIRVDRYFEGDADAPTSFFQPVLCMHCEQAPCENVCPVGATVHDSEGLNVMVYNRCVGTRFCSNNCPYKVRRFNFFAYAHEQKRPPESWNPDVTVRARGVMEKCSYCIQRIAAARIDADRESRPVGEVVTACQAACPTRAITFGNLADGASEVAARKQSPLTFAMLPAQNTHPRTTYEAPVRNPNPALEGGS